MKLPLVSPGKVMQACGKLTVHLEWQVYWFDRFLNGNASTKRPNEE